MTDNNDAIDGVMRDTARMVASKIEVARRFIRASEEYLKKIGEIQELGGEAPQAESVEWRVADDHVRALLEGLDLAGVAPPWKAIIAFLKHVQKPQPRKVIVRALILGGCTLGVRREKSVNQAISMNVALKKLKEPGATKENGPDPESLVGLPGWPDKMFKA